MYERKKVSIFKSICWCILLLIISLLVGGVISLILVYIISWLRGVLNIIDKILSNKVVFFIFMTAIAADIGRRTSGILMGLFKDAMVKSRNVGKGFLGAGILLIIDCIITLIVMFSRGGVKYLDLSTGFMGFWYIFYGRISEDEDEYSPQDIKVSTRKQQNPGMTEEHIKEYAEYIRNNCKMIELPPEEAEGFVRGILNVAETEGKEAALQNFIAFKNWLKNTDKAYWFAKISYYNGLLQSNCVISETEMNQMAEEFLNEQVAGLTENKA